MVFIRGRLFRCFFLSSTLNHQDFHFGLVIPEHICYYTLVTGAVTLCAGLRTGLHVGFRAGQQWMGGWAGAALKPNLPTDNGELLWITFL